MYVYVVCVCMCVCVCRRRPIMLKILPIMLLSSAKNVAYYAQFMPITTAIIPQFIYSFIILMITLAWLGFSLLCFILCYDAILLYLT